ncbi:hypothetical protein BDZ45DRAFT_776473 [Acephala macrosclerotiorum]|nr:hypothetical protein BDZ45DRAFT_776473 [Acephala macrosclerotiorum]
MDNSNKPASGSMMPSPTPKPSTDMCNGTEEPLQPITQDTETLRATSMRSTPNITITAASTDDLTLLTSHPHPLLSPIPSPYSPPKTFEAILTRTAAATPITRIESSPFLPTPSRTKSASFKQTTQVEERKLTEFTCQNPQLTACINELESPMTNAKELDKDKGREEMLVAREESVKRREEMVAYREEMVREREAGVKRRSVIWHADGSERDTNELIHEQRREKGWKPVDDNEEVADGEWRENSESRDIPKRSLKWLEHILGLKSGGGRKLRKRRSAVR